MFRAALGWFGVALVVGLLGCSVSHTGRVGVMFDSSGSALVRSSRIFAGSEQYPPKDFAAYGILAFTSTPASYDRDRFLMICEAYVAAIPHTSNLQSVPHKEQMVTVWPIKEKGLANELNLAHRRNFVDRHYFFGRVDFVNRLGTSDYGMRDICMKAVYSYDLVVSRQAIREAQLADVTFSGIGPYLLAWSPGRVKGEQDALVLMSDLSGLTKYEDVKEVFVQWTHDIEKNPELWKQGWNLESVRQLIRTWADKFGPAILSLVSEKS